MQHSTERRHKKNGSVQRYIERHPKAQKLKCAICNQQVGGSNPSTSSSSSRTSVRAKAPVEGPGLFSSLRRSSLPHETLLHKFSWGPRQGMACPMDSAPFLLLPTKLCFANFRGGPGRKLRQRLVDFWKGRVNSEKVRCAACCKCLRRIFISDRISLPNSVGVCYNSPQTDLFAPEHEWRLFQ